MKHFWLITIFLTLLFLPNAVFAQNLNREEKIEQLKQASAQQKCSLVSQNVERLIKEYDQLRDKKISKYYKALEVIDLANKRLKELNKDTTELSSAYTEFDNKVLELDELHADLIFNLEESRDYLCDNDTESYIDSVNNTGIVITELKQKDKDIRNYYSNDLRNIILEIEN